MAVTSSKNGDISKFFSILDGAVGYRGEYKTSILPPFFIPDRYSTALLARLYQGDCFHTYAPPSPFAAI